MATALQFHAQAFEKGRPIAVQPSLELSRTLVKDSRWEDAARVRRLVALLPASPSCSRLWHRPLHLPPPCVQRGVRPDLAHAHTEAIDRVPGWHMLTISMYCDSFLQVLLQMARPYSGQSWVFGAVEQRLSKMRDAANSMEPHSDGRQRLEGLLTEIAVSARRRERARARSRFCSLYSCLDSCVVSGCAASPLTGAFGLAQL